MNLPMHARITDNAFREAVRLLDAGDVEGLRRHVDQRPELTRQRVYFEGAGYFETATLLEFIAENPVRHGRLPGNIVQVAETILDAGAERDSVNVTLMLVCSGRVPRECGVQLPLIELLCDRGAEPGSAIRAAAVHGEMAAVNALFLRGAPVDLPVAAALGREGDVLRQLAEAGKEDRHLGLAFAAQFGHAKIVALLLDAGEDTDRYNPAGGHAHSTPLHQAALAGHESVVRLLVERGARVDIKDTLWQGTPSDWARHEARTEVERYLRSKETMRE